MRRKNYKPFYNVETHPFGSFVPNKAKQLILGTFPTHKDNWRFDFFYSGQNNLFWEILAQVFGHHFQYFEGENAVAERKLVLSENKIGLADMHEMCYRRNTCSTDESLFTIVMTDVFSILKQNPSIERIILTSRTEIIGALGLLKTYFLQQGMELNEPLKRDDKILEGHFENMGKKIKLFVPYSPSFRLISKKITTLDELVSMYRHCLT